MLSFLSNIFGSSNDRILKRMMVHVNHSNDLEEEISNKPDSYFKELKHELNVQYKNNNDLYSILPLAFAAVREASKRTLGLRHFDSQMLGGISLAEGNIAEMKTGEGKTLVATLPAYLNSAIGNKAVLVTVNDYLAKRDAEWMRPIYEFLGLTVGVVNSNQDIKEKIDAYKCDVIYATNNELGFDYLRDNMAHSVEERVQCSLDFAIVDEVDSILIDEARTPLIISGPSSESSDLYQQIRKFIPKLSKQLREETEEEPLSENERGHYLIDEKNRSVELTDDGYFLVEGLLEDAGITGPTATLWNYNIKDWNSIININLHGTFYCSKLIVPHMIKNNYGRIVNIASVAGKDGNANASAYSSAKAGVIGLTKSLGKELAKYNIAVNAITPAGAKTKILDQMSKEHVQWMLSKVPRGRFLELNELTSMVCWLSSEENSFSTAAVFDISGGRSTY